MFTVSMLPALRGDCLLLEYGEPAHPYRVLIDGGPAKAYSTVREWLKSPQGSVAPFELLVVSHIDVDHVEGMIRLQAERATLGLEAGDVWFNDVRHLPANDRPHVGAAHGEQLAQMLTGQPQWNSAFGGEAVMVAGTGPLPVRTLPGGLKLTLLSPTNDKLVRLRSQWEAIVRGRGQHHQEEDKVDPGPRRKLLGLEDEVLQLAGMVFKEDVSIPNGSSIAFLAEYEGKRVLLGGDAHPSLLAASLRRLFSPKEGQRIRVHACKPPHHGSRRSLSPELIRLLNCDHYLISSDGSYFQHPSPETIARILVHACKAVNLWFNYRTRYNERWSDPALQARFDYLAHYPAAGAGISVTL